MSNTDNSVFAGDLALSGPTPTEGDTRPLIIFDGNCQAHHLSAIFDAGGLGESIVNGRDFGTIPAFRGRLARYADEGTCMRLMEEAKSLGRPCIQATQSTPWSDTTQTLYTPLADEIVRFPYLHCSIYLNAQEPIAGRNYARLYEADLDVIRLCQEYARSTFDFSGFIKTEQQHRPLFHMHVHPGAALMSALVREVGGQSKSIAAENLDSLAVETARREGINVFTQHPIHEAVQAALSFDWRSPYDDYAALIKAHRRGDWAALIADRGLYEASFSHETQFWFALFQAAIMTRHESLAEETFERLTMLAPGFPELWVMMYAFGGRHPQSLLDRAGSVFGTHRLLDYILCRAATIRGDHATALFYGNRLFAAGPDLNDGFVPLMLALIGAGETSRARDIAFQFAMAADETRRPEIRTILANYPETRDIVVPD